MLLQKERKKKEATLFLLLPRLSAWVESLYVDHGLLSEDALAVVDRDRVCDGSHSYSTETVKGGAMRGSRLPSLVFLLTLLTVFTLSTLTSKGMQSWRKKNKKLSSQIKFRTVFSASAHSSFSSKCIKLTAARMSH